MSVRIDQSPYFDDFDKSKKFQKILFKPEVAVQVREMNQLQSILKDQIKKFGDNIFKEGSIVIPGENSFDTNYSYAKVTINNYSSVVDLLKNTGNKAIGQTSSVVAVIDMFVEPEEADPSTFYLKYVSSSATSPIFVAGETLNIENVGGDVFATAVVDEVGVGSVFSTSDGVYYVKGNFVYVQAQDIIVSKYTSVIDGIIGFDINESAITATDDTTLYDNAAGTPNESAPGADRLVIDLVLAKYDTAPDDFVELAVFDNGVLKKLARSSEYNVLNDVLAKRTYDESGNYTVEDFGIQVREHLKVDNNKGLYADGDESLFVVGVEAGRAYVRGYEVENLSTTYIEVDKARETQSINNSTFSLTLGSYIVVSNLEGIPVLNDHKTLTFYDSASQSGNVLGTAKVRAVRAVEANKYHLFVFDIQNSSGVSDTSFLGSVVSVGNDDIAADLLENVIYETSTNSYVYPLPVRNTKTLLNDSVSDTSFSKLTTFTDSLNASGVATLNSPNGSTTFISQSDAFCVIHFTDDGETLAVATNTSLGGTPTGSTLTLDMGVSYANRPFVIQVAVAVQNGSHKTKTVSQFTLTDATVVDGIIDLGYADVFEIVSIVDGSGNDVADQFKLVPNRKQRFYDISYVQKTGSLNVASATIVAKRFVSSTSGDYFSVDSYESIDYKDIPKDIINGETISLADVIDFRSVINSADNFSGAGAVVLSTPVPLSLCRVDVDYYLPRIDKVFVDSNGTFNVSKGIPAESPTEPSDIDGTMTLCTIEVPAYTASAGLTTITKVNNRRYTMKDIGDIENRVSTIEEFVGLNELEKSTADTQIIDVDTGLQRFKNGFMVDQFIDHTKADYEADEYAVSVDPIEGRLLPEFKMDSLDIESASTANVVVNNGVATLAFSEVPFASQTDSNGELRCNDAPVFRFNGVAKIDNAIDTWFSKNVEYDILADGDNVRNLEQKWKSWEINWSGYKASKPISSNSKIVNDKFLSTNVIPYIRTKVITISVEGMSPNTRLYCFVDGDDVNENCRTIGGVYGETLVADSDGALTFELLISDTEYQFRVGSKVISIVDNENNDKTTALSYADCVYTVSGVIEKRKQGSIGTRPNRKNELTNVTGSWNNPLSQSFVVSEIDGVFVTSVDLYFSAKDDVHGVVVELREMQTGLPTDNIVAGSISYKPASDIAVDGSATTFSFDYPIYLLQGNEYCVTIKTNSNEYKVFVAETGQNSLDSSYVSKQPFVGSVFKTQSGSWIPYENLDLKFVLNKASFVGSGSLNAVNKVLERTELQKPFTTTNGSDTVVVNYNDHGFTTGDEITITNASSGNGIIFNGTYVVSNVVDYNVFEIVANEVASATGIADTDAVIDSSMQIHVIEPNFVNIKLPNTGLSHSLVGVSSKSFAGTETKDVQTTLNNVVNAQTNVLNAPIYVNEVTDLNIDFEFSSSNTNLSPVLDLTASNIVVVQNKINDSDYTKYISKIASVNEPAIGVVAFVDVLQPSTALVELQYRVGNSDEEVESSEFASMVRNTDQKISSSEYTTQEFEINDLNGFTHYQIRIVMNSTSDTNVPSCKNLKIIALGT